MFKDLFGRKKIENLKTNITNLLTDLQYARNRGAAKESELAILQEAFRNGVRITDELKEKVASLVQVRNNYASKIAEAREANDDLDRRNRDLEYQNQLLVTVLQTLRILIKLPARVDKTARK